jgi:hypothetical protein
MGAITAYRFYYVDSDGQLDGPPTIVECKDDRAAIKTAGQLLLDGKDIMVWDGGREVIRLAANLADADVFEGAPELLSRRGTQF